MIWQQPFIVEQSQRIIQCYDEITGENLRQRLNIDADLRGDLLAKALFHAPAAILSHDITVINGQRSNIYNYANQTALNLFERSFEEQTQLASSHSAATNDRAQGARNSLLAQCLAHGSVRFSSQRLSASGATVYLHDALLFNLFDVAGLYAGQAVVFTPES